MKENPTIKSNGSASLGELQQFLSTLKGRSPQEVIGIVSTSLLVQSLITAVVSTLIGLAVFTIVPYLLFGPIQAGPTTAQVPAAATTAPPLDPTGASESQAATPAVAAPSDSTALDPAKPDLEKATQALGLEETKQADPGKNPLESSPDLDKLLDQ